MSSKFKSLFSAQDLTEGPPFSCLLRFSIPLLIGNFAQLLYTTADAIIVGRLIGDDALAAIGASMPPFNFFIVIFIGLGSGVTVMVSQYFGARDYHNLGLSIGNSITLIAIASVIITAIATPLSGAILRMVDTPPDAFNMAEAYMRVLFLGAAGNGFYNVLSAILRGMGDSVFPLLVLISTVVLSTALDLVLIAGFGMGVEGVAWATVVAQALSSVICLIKIMTMRNIVKIGKAMLKPVKRIIGQIIRLGGPIAISMGVMFASNIVVQALINSMGESVMAALTATMRLDMFAVIPSQTFQIVAGAFTGQNIGAGKMDRVRQGTKTVLLMCSAFTAVMVIGMVLFGRHLIGLFTQTESIIEMGVGFIRIMAPAYLAMALSGSWSGVIRGAGDSIGPMWIALFNNVVLRTPLAYVFAHFTQTARYPNGDPNSIYYSLMSSMVVGCIITAIYYRTGRWRNKSVVGTDPQAAG